MTETLATTTILVADDDDEDVDFLRDAIEESDLPGEFRTVSDGIELLEYLRREGRFAEPELAPRPSLILLDLKMPRMDGLEALRQIKADRSLARIPVVVLTTSGAEGDVLAAYDGGASSYIRKPLTFQELVDSMKSLTDYWFHVVALPRGES